MPKKPVEAIEEQFSNVPDPRKDRPRDHKLIDISAIAICEVICNGEGWDCSYKIPVNSTWPDNILGLAVLAPSLIHRIS